MRALLYLAALCITATAQLTQETTDTDLHVIVRPNYGAIFQHVGRLSNSGSYWYHSLAIPMWKRRHLPIQEDFCDYKDNNKTGLYRSRKTPEEVILRQLCTQFRPAFQSYNRENQDLLNIMMTNEEAIRTLLPPQVQKESADDRTRRSVMPIIGRLARSAFGVATVGDIQKVSRAIRTIEEQAEASTRTVLQLQDDLHSYQVTVNDRVTNLRKATELNARTLNDTIQKLINWKEQIDHLTPILQQHSEAIDMTQKAVTLLHVYATQRTDRLRTLVQESYQRVQAVQTLLKGYLPAHLVPPEALKPILTSVRRFLQTQYPNFALSHAEIADYYHLPNVLYAHTSRYLYLTLRIPITTSDTMFELYKLTALPVPLTTTNTTGYTMIRETAPFLAMSPSGTFFFELTTEELATCAGSTVRHCPHLFAARERDALTCSAALFTDQLDAVNKLCKAQLYPSTPYPANTVVDLGDGRLFVSSTDSSWTKTCVRKSPETITPCRFCIMTLECACSLRGPSIYIPATFWNCKSEGRNLTEIAHPINMLFLSKFYDVSSILNPGGQALLPQPLELTLPDLDVYTNEFNDIMQRDNELALDLNDAAEAYKARSTIYPSETAHLAKQISWVTDSRTPPLLMTSQLTSVTLSIVSMTLTGINRGFMALATQAATSIPKAVSLPLSLKPKLIATASPISTATAAPPTCFTWTVTSIVMATVLTCVGLYLIIMYLRRYCRKYRPIEFDASHIQTDLHLVFYDIKDSLSFHVTTIPAPMAKLQYTLRGPILPRFVNNWYNPHIVVNWALLKMTTDHQDQVLNATPKLLGLAPTSIPLPAKIPVPFSMRYRFSKLFNNLLTCKIILCNNNASIALRPTLPEVPEPNTEEE